MGGLQLSLTKWSYVLYGNIFYVHINEYHVKEIFFKNPVLPSGVPDHFNPRRSRLAKLWVAVSEVPHCIRTREKDHHLLHTSLPAAGICAVPAVFSVTNTVIHVDFHIIQRNVSVGVGLFCTAGWSHRHTLSASLATSRFLYHTLFFISSHSHSHTAFVLLRFSCCPLPLWFLPCWLFCWQTQAGCHGWDRGGNPSV